MFNLENKIVSNITVYFDNLVKNIPPYLFAKQYDSNSRYIIVKMMGSEGQYIVTSRCQLNATKPDGTHIYADGEINQDGTVTFEISSNMLSAVGNVSCDVSIFDVDDDSRVLLTSSTFYIVVDKSNYDEDAIESSDEFPALLNAITNRANGIQYEDNELQLTSDGIPIGDPVEVGEASIVIPPQVTGYDVVFASGSYLIDTITNLVDFYSYNVAVSFSKNGSEYSATAIGREGYALYALGSGLHEIIFDATYGEVYIDDRKALFGQTDESAVISMIYSHDNIVTEITSDGAPGVVNAGMASENDDTPCNVGQDGRLYVDVLKKTFLFKITLNTNDDTSPVSCDKTFAEILQAYNSGSNLKCLLVQSSSRDDFVVESQSITVNTENNYLYVYYAPPSMFDLYYITIDDRDQITCDVFSSRYAVNLQSTDGTDWEMDVPFAEIRSSINSGQEIDIKITIGKNTYNNVQVSYKRGSGSTAILSIYAVYYDTENNLWYKIEITSRGIIPRSAI